MSLNNIIEERYCNIFHMLKENHKALLFDKVTSIQKGYTEYANDIQKEISTVNDLLESVYSLMLFDRGQNIENFSN